jgi:hypothetical protein
MFLDFIMTKIRSSAKMTVFFDSAVMERGRDEIAFTFAGMEGRIHIAATLSGMAERQGYMTAGRNAQHRWKASQVLSTRVSRAERMH